MADYKTTDETRALLGVDVLERDIGRAYAATRFFEASGSISPTVYRTYSFTSGVTSEVAVVVRPIGNRSQIQLYSNGVGNLDAVFDLSTMTATTSKGTASIKYLGAGRYECITANAASGTGTSNIQARPMLNGSNSYTGSPSEGLIIESLVVRAPNTTANLFPASDPAGASFTKLHLSPTAITAPERRLAQDIADQVAEITDLKARVFGSRTMDKLVMASGSNLSPLLYRTVSWVAGADYVFEVEAKASELRRMNLYVNTTNHFDFTFDLEKGTVAGTSNAGATASIEHLGNGTYRCRVSLTAGATGNANFQIRLFNASGGQPLAGDGTSGLFVEKAEAFKDGGANFFTSSNDFTNAAWIKLNASVTPNAGIYLGLSDAADYEDGSAALVGLKWAALGSSITAQAQYTGPLASETGMVLQNLGVSGGCFASGGNAGSLKCYEQIPNIAADTDLVTVEVSPNDFGKRNSTLGALGDTTTATFYGALYATVVGIQAQAPNARIVFLTPFGADSRFPDYSITTADARGDRFIDFYRAAKEVAALLGLPCIDVGGEGGFGYLTNGALTSDGLHPNAIGGARYASFVAAKLRAAARAGQIA